MPQMFPMNWWFLSLLPLTITIINMIFMTFNKNLKPNQKIPSMYKNKMLFWKW